MRKGFVLTMDSVLALTTAIIMSATIIGIISTNQRTDYLSTQQMFSISNDFLAVLDLSNKLNSYVGQPANSVNTDLGLQLGFLPKQYCGNITVSIYDGDKGPPISFSLYANSNPPYNNISSGCIRKSDFIKVKRIFIDFDTDTFSIAELELWLR